MISCKNLRLDYPDGEGFKNILDNVNLQIKGGENVILLGPSGSGKSSLIYLLSTLRKPTSGEIFFNDINLSKVNEKTISSIRKQHFGFIFQMHFLLPYLSITENVLIGDNLKSYNKNKAEEILSRLGLGGHFGKKLYQLSGGQRQRVAIARALMNEPDVVFADEPTASLDHKTAVEVLKILKSYKKDSMLIMATHDTSILAGDERIIKVSDGNTEEVK